jgi:hypothetical protein
MYGIKSKTAKFIATAALAFGVTAASVAVLAAPAAAGGGSHYGKYGYDDDRGYGHREGPGYWRKHGHHGVTVHFWKPVAPRPAYYPRRVQAACHPVIGRGTDHFGRAAKFGGTMCYDRFGRGYVVPGSRHVIHYY